MSRKQRTEILEVDLKRSKIFSSDQGKIMSVFDFGIFNVLIQFCVISRGTFDFFRIYNGKVTNINSLS